MSDKTNNDTEREDDLREEGAGAPAEQDTASAGGESPASFGSTDEASADEASGDNHDGLRQSVFRQGREVDSERDSRKLRIGGYASLVTIGVIAVVLIFNVIIGRTDATIDLTAKSVFSLSEQGRSVIEGVDQEITIYALARRGAVRDDVSAILDTVAAASPRIQIVPIDPDENPGVLSPYVSEEEPARLGSLIVVGERYHKVIPQEDVVRTMSGQESGMNIPPTDVYTAERSIVNALLFVASGSTPRIYELTGHRETPLDSLSIDLVGILNDENFEVAELNLITEPAVPDDAQMLLIFSPASDITEAEAEKIRDYLNAGGSALIAVDIRYAMELPVFESLFESFGFTLTKGIVFEVDADMYTNDNPLYLVPTADPEHPITKPLTEAGYSVVMPFGRSIAPTEVRRRELSFDPLLTTSDEAFERLDLQQGSTDKLPGDGDGPFTVGVAIYDRFADQEQSHTRIVVFGSPSIIEPYPLAPGNIELFTNAVTWLQQRTETIEVRPKYVFSFPLEMTATQTYVLAAVFVIVVPLTILVLGLIVWLRRRHK